MEYRYHDWIAYHAKMVPNKVAIVDAASDRHITYKDLDQRVGRLAVALSRQCGQAGARVMVLARTGLEAFELQFACARAGVIFLPVNWRLAVPELTFIVRDAKPAVIYCETEFATQARALAEVHPVPIVDINASDALSGYEQILGADSSGDWQPPVVDWEDTWMILYTSGTTGKPKGAMLSYRMMYFNVLNFSPALLGPDTTFLCVMPTFHTGGVNCYANPVFCLGGTVVTMREFNAIKALELLTDTTLKISHFFGVPAIYLSISELPDFRAASFPFLKVAGLGGAPATNKLVSTWLEKGVPVQPAYGMTEIGPAILVTPIDMAREKIGSAGQPVMNMEFRIAGIDGVEMPLGQVGEIWVKGPVLLSGYWMRPDAARDSFYEGWFRTGDAARRDADGYIFIVDRLKDMYISGGENVYPVEVENVIGNHPGVVAVAVIGIPDDKWGEVGCAYICTRDGQAIELAELREHCERSLAKYKIPKKFIFVSEFPRTASGKVLKTELRKRFTDVS